MSTVSSSQSVDASDAPRYLPVLLLLFAASGCAALIYEIVWFQMLGLVIGSSAISLAVLLGTFMGGMCIGCLALPRFISDARHPLRVYAGIEGLIGIIGLAVLWGMPLVDSLYSAVATGGSLGIALRAVISAVCLLPPTVLMGATLPAIARWIKSNPDGVSWLGFFYGGNIAGAVFGCLLAGFYLLRFHDSASAVYVAVAINFSAALVSLALSSIAPHAASGRSVSQPAVAPAQGAWSIYITIGVSGGTALAAEVVWTRLLSLLLGGTVYTFSIILAVFLIGLGVGSSIGSVLGRSSRRPRVVLGWCQFLLAAAIAWTAFVVARSLPFWPVDVYLVTNPWNNFQLDLMRCFWAIFPATCLWGASFPLALAAVASNGADPGRLVSRIYAANTLGAIVGALLASLILVRIMGTQQAQKVLIAASAFAALFALIPDALFLSNPSSAANGRRSLAGQLFGGLGILAAACCCVAMLWTVSETPWELIAYGRCVATQKDKGTMLFMGEGMNSSVAVTELSDGVRNFHVSGKIEASSDMQDMRLQRMLCHFPALVHPNPKSVLIVGCGAGVTSGSFLVYPSIERIVICELEPLVPQVVAKYFGKENYDVVKNPKVEIVYDDARHFILTTKEKFDIITSDPIHPWMKGSATLYTKEYFELVKRHLNPGGVVTQWVPLYESSEEVVKSEIGTFFEAFPGGTVWGNDRNGEGYDVVLLGQLGPTRIDIEAMQNRLNRQDHVPVVNSLQDIGMGSAIRLLATYAGQAADLTGWLKDAEINHDRNLRLQYLAGLFLNSYAEKAIYENLLAQRRFPDELFSGTEQHRASLKWALEHHRTDQP
jgi:spermidine synthase